MIVLNLQDVSVQQSLLSCYLQSLKFDSRISCMQIKPRAEQNPLDSACLEVSSCWLCLLSDYFSVSSSSCGCYTDPNPCVRLLLFSNRLHWLLSEKRLRESQKLICRPQCIGKPGRTCVTFISLSSESCCFSLKFFLSVDSPVSTCQSSCGSVKAHTHHMSPTPNQRKDRLYLWVAVRKQLERFQHSHSFMYSRVAHLKHVGH